MKIVKARRNVENRYDEIIVWDTTGHSWSSGHLTVPEADRVVERLLEEGIETTIGSYNPT